MLNIKKSAFRLAIQALIEVYNSGVENPSEYLVLVNQGTGKMIETEAKKVFDTKEIFVCVYDDNCVGAFKGETYIYNSKNSNPARTHFWYYTNSGMIYKDLISKQVGISHAKWPKGTKESPAEWKQKGFEINDCIATCSMTKAVSFEKIRSDLKNDCVIGQYKPGIATLEDINKVLELAPKYLGLTQEQDKTKQKV